VTTAEQVNPRDPRLSRRDLGIVNDLVEHALGRARAGTPLTWYDAVAYVRAHPAASASGDNAPTVAVIAVNRLEETGEIVYDLHGDWRLRRNGDPTLARDLSVIESAVVGHMRAGRDSSVWKLYAEVFRGAHVHRDVYYACRTLLTAGLLKKPNAQGPILRYVPPVTTRRVELPVEPPPGPPVEELRERSRQVEGLPDEAPERQQLEADLVAALAAHLRQLGHRVDCEELSAAGPCDLLDRTIRLLVEAKSDGSRARVRAAWAQALDYRDELNAESDEERATVEQLAILTPVPPCEGAVTFLQRRLDDCGGTLTLIYPDDTGWATEQLEGQ
jgi:hypothetical protein